MERELDALSAYIRSNLERSYDRLRVTREQGQTFADNVFLLNMLRDMQVVPLAHEPDEKGRNNNRTLKIPLIFADHWTLYESGTFLRHWESSEKKFATMFAPQDGRQSEMGLAEESIHSALVDYVERFLNKYKRTKLLLDVVKRPSFVGNRRIWGGPGFLHSENRGAFYGGGPKDPHPLYKDLRAELPNLLTEVQALVRLTFPLDTTEVKPPFKMGTVILGLKVDDQSRQSIDENGEVSDRLMGELIRLCELLHQEIPKRYIDYKNVHQRSRAARPPDIEKNELQDAVNLLHMEIAALASRRGLKDWTLPPRSQATNGYNFMIAFRELSRTFLTGQLRYYLTDLNYQALRASLSQPSQWADKARYRELRRVMTKLFARTHPAPEAKVLAGDYVRRCEKEARQVVVGRSDLDEVARDLHRLIESKPYPLHLTPGYHVMTLGYPEIVRDWLSDTRARAFEDYPHLLLAWENLAMPREMYYSPIADGDIRFGICGVNAELLDCGGVPELRRLIDDSAVRFRNIICNTLIRELQSDLSKARLYGKADEALWSDALWHFRQLAFYYLPHAEAYFTKLVSDDGLAGLDAALSRAHLKWGEGETKRWWFVKECMNGRVVSELRRLRSVLDEDRLEEYLGRDTRCEEDEDGTCLFRIKLQSEPGLSLLVAVPSPHDYQHATELIHRFTSACDTALVAERRDTRREAGLREIGHEFVYLLPLLRACLSSADCGRVKEIKLLTDVLENEVAYFTETFRDITGGEPVNLRQFFRLLSSVQQVINHGVTVTKGGLRGALASVKPDNLLILKKGIDRFRRSAAYREAADLGLGISRSAALLLLWGVSINLCKHAKSWVRFTVEAGEARGLKLVIKSDRHTSQVDHKGRHGIDHIRHVAKVAGVGFLSGLSHDDERVFTSTLTFSDRVNFQ